jgi:hypothetical protein
VISFVLQLLKSYLVAPFQADSIYAIVLFDLSWLLAFFTAKEPDALEHVLTSEGLIDVMI